MSSIGSVVSNSAMNSSLRIQYKNETTFEQRRALSRRIIEQYPDRVPVIVEKVPGANVPEIKKKKFLSPGDVTVGKFLEEVRKQLGKYPAGVQPDRVTITFLFANNTKLPHSGTLMEQVYQTHSDEDGFLYILYMADNIFGK